LTDVSVRTLFPSQEVSVSSIHRIQFSKSVTPVPGAGFNSRRCRLSSEPETQNHARRRVGHGVSVMSASEPGFYLSVRKRIVSHLLPFVNPLVIERPWPSRHRGS